MIKHKTDKPLTIEHLKKALEKMPNNAVLHIKGTAFDNMLKTAQVSTFVETIHLDVENNKVIFNF